MTTGSRALTLAGTVAAALFLAACSGSDSGGGAGGGGGTAPSGGSGAMGGASGTSGTSGTAGVGGASGSSGMGGGAGQGFRVATCAPTEVSFTELDRLPANVVTIAGSFAYLRALEGKGDALYVLLDDSLLRVDGDSTVATAVATAIEGIVGTNSPAGDGPLRLTDTHAYFATEKGISRVELASGTVEVVYDGLMSGNVSGVNAPDFIAVDGDVVYFAVRELGQIYSVPAAGGAAQLLADGLTPEGLAARGGYVYITDYGAESVVRFPTSGGTPERVGPTPDPFATVVGLAVTDSAVYWLDDDTIQSVALAAPSTVTALGPAQDGNLTVVGDRLYWQGDAVGYTALDGSGCTTVVFGDFPDYAEEYGITTSYVFVGGSEVLLRVPKN